MHVEDAVCCSEMRIEAARGQARAAQLADLMRRSRRSLRGRRPRVDPVHLAEMARIVRLVGLRIALGARSRARARQCGGGRDNTRARRGRPDQGRRAALPLGARRLLEDLEEGDDSSPERVEERRDGDAIHDRMDPVRVAVDERPGAVGHDEEEGRRRGLARDRKPARAHAAETEAELGSDGEEARSELIEVARDHALLAGLGLGAQGFEAIALVARLLELCTEVAHVADPTLSRAGVETVARVVASEGVHKLGKLAVVSLLGALGLTLPIACSSSDPAPPGFASASGDVLLGVALHGASISVEATEPADDAIELAPVVADQPTLTWQLLAADGHVVASGTAGDPRIQEHESFSADGHALGAKEVVLDQGLLELVVPNTGGTLVVSDAQKEIGRTTIAPLLNGASSVGPSGLGTSRARLGTEPPVKIVDNGRCGGHINILVVGEGFTLAEQPRFHELADRVGRGLQGTTGWGEHFDLVNVWRYDLASKESGLSDPGCNNRPDECPGTTIPAVTRDTALGASYGTVVRRAATFDATKAGRLLTSAIATMKATSVVVLVNSNDPNIGASYTGTKYLIQSASFDSVETLAHELGHNILQLADEYGGSADASCKDGRAIASNTTKTPASPSWKGIVSTPPFEGASGCEKGIWRPTETCLMRDLSAPLCPVCANRMKTFFDGRAARSKTNPPAVCKQFPDAGTTPVKDCKSGGPACATGLVCAWNGDGHCCKLPFTGAKECDLSSQCSDADAAVGTQICSLGELAGPDGGNARSFCTTPNQEACLDRAPAAEDECGPSLGCNVKHPGQNLVCSENGRGAHCCRTPQVVGDERICQGDQDCKGNTICAQLSDGEGGVSFGCIAPDEGCVK